MSNSALATYVDTSTNKYSYRAEKISRVTVHHAAGVINNISVFSSLLKGDRDASWNYAIANDGTIGLFVSEEHRAWTSSSSDNDNKAVTIEVANSTGDPDWRISDAAMTSLLKLCADICTRNGIKQLTYTGQLAGSNYTMHKWFAPTGCPGPYLISKAPEIVQKVNSMIGNVYTVGNSSAQSFEYNPPSGTPQYVIDFINKIGKPVVKYARSYGICVHSAVICQACIETGFGQDGTLSKYNNFFGMKAGSSWTGPTVTYGGFEEYTPGVYTDIVTQWRTYPDVDTGVKGYFEFLQADRYQNLKGITDPLQYIKTLGEDGYYTSTTYVQQCSIVIDRYDLRQWDTCVGGMIIPGVGNGIEIIDKNFIHKTTDFYIIQQDRYSPDIDYSKIPDIGYSPDKEDEDYEKDKDILGIVIEAGQYFNSNYAKNEVYKNPKLDQQVKACKDAGYPWGFYTSIKARTPQEARNELYALALVVRNYPPRLGLWFSLDFPTTSVYANNLVIDEYYHWLVDYYGFKDQIGFYTTSDKLALIDWAKYQNDWFLWLIDHPDNLDDFEETLTPEFFIREWTDEKKVPIWNPDNPTVSNTSSTSPSGGDATGSSGNNVPDGPIQIVDSTGPAGAWLMWPSYTTVITSPYGMRTNPVTGVYTMHQGVDIGAANGTAIWAAADGTVALAGWNGGYGNCVIINHKDNYSTLYGHQSRVIVNSGQSVVQGQVIGYVGSTGQSTGPHIHFEVRINNNHTNPKNYQYKYHSD